MKSLLCRAVALRFLLLMLFASCGTPIADAPSDDVFGDELGFVNKGDVAAYDSGKPADAAADAAGKGDAVPDAASEIADTAADVPAADAAVPDGSDATATGDSDEAPDAAADAAVDVTAPVDDGPPALCRPCGLDSECQKLNLAAVCIAYGASGSFCGSGCKADADCPTGYACADAEGSGGPAASKQCLRKNGVCPCSQQAIADGAKTPCSNKNALGTCPGVRTCLASGLSACDAPSATTEACNGVDDNCDGITDGANALGCTPFYPDKDGDGFGAGSPVCLCSAAGTGLSASGTDCDDNNAAVYPGAPELCNDADDNCNGVTDEGCDGDGDSWCAATATVVGKPKVCPFGGGDCNDASAAVHPGQPEICGNGVDDDCDGTTDVGIGGPGCTAFYLDADGDGYGTGASQCACGPEGAYTASKAGDCDDKNASVHPNAQEICGNGLDDNCNGQQDEGAGVGCTLWYVDADGDGYGTGAGVCLCLADAGHTASKGGDCNDAAASIHPGAPELCNNIDDNCNGLTDDGPPVDCTDFYADKDKDGYGGTDMACLCAADAVHTVTIGGDCNDASSAVHPGATEICNQIDDNCNGQTDELGAQGCSSFHPDADGDGYGGKDVKCACAADPIYHTLDATDCDDTNPNVHPGAKEICNGIDDNCDGITDPPNLDTCTNFFYDGDADGYGNALIQVKCLCAGSGLWSATVPGDCNDANGAIHPGATEVCNGVDDNCDGQIDNGAGTFYYADGDGDGYGNPLVFVQSCTPVATFVTNKLDCNDGNAAIHPGAIEICDGVDNDCNGLTDDGLCDDGNACTTDSCVPGSGCNHVPTTSACNDGNACTTGDSCATGTCVGMAVSCDDGNACTADACASASGCTHAPTTGACSDGNACTSGDSCTSGTCKSGATLSCDDANVCTTDSCVPASGCSHANNALVCSDGSACTSGDVCTAGACKGTTLSCDDGNACTTDACVPASGCTHTQTCATLPFADPGSTYAEGMNAAGKLLAWGSAATPPTGTFTQVSAGYYFACVVNASNQMQCWGANTPTALTSTQTGIAQVSVGKPHACVVKTDGTLQCWNYSGSAQTTGTPTGAFVQVSCGQNHSCALRADGTVACWGTNTYGQTTVPGGATFSQIAAGDNFTCGIRKSGGGITCWGDDSVFAVSKAPATGSFIGIAAGSMACAVQADNTLACWTTTASGSSTPPAGSKWLSVGAGENVVCGVLTSKAVQCFGDDSNGVVSGVPVSGW